MTLPRSLMIALSTLTLSAAVSLHTAEAAACECEFKHNVFPMHRSTGVPTNTKIWIQTSLPGCDTLTLRDADEAAVDTAMTEIGPDLRVLTPTAPLVTGEEYTLFCDAIGNSPNSTFTVGQTDDTLAPPVPQMLPGETRRSGLGSSCGDREFVIIGGQQAGEILLMDVAGRATFDPQTLSGSVVAAFSSDDFLFIGEEACDFNWSFDDDGVAEDVRFGSLDLAGNFSGWSGGQTVAPSCGCQLPAGRRGGNWAALGLAALAAAALRRRRRRSAVRADGQARSLLERCDFQRPDDSGNIRLDDTRTAERAMAVAAPAGDFRALGERTHV